MSSSSDYISTAAVPVTILQYRDIGGTLPRENEGPSESASRPADPPSKSRAEIEISEAEFAARIKHEREDAAREVEQRIRLEFEQKLFASNAPIAEAIAAFDEQRDDYFARVESEVVQLALSIAAKILHREAQVDPTLVATLVRMAIENMREGSSVTVRVDPAKVEGMKTYFAKHPNMAGVVEVTADSQLSEHDCIVETELGSANFGLDTQLKEVERGFFDLLALRPAKR
jgi:flagellar assembly protein FliH